MTPQFLVMINQEVERQKQLHPNWNPDDLDRNCAIIGEECGEVCGAALDLQRNKFNMLDLRHLHAELIQVATFAIRWAGHLEGRGTKNVKDITDTDNSGRTVGQ